MICVMRSRFALGKPQASGQVVSRAASAAAYWPGAP